MKLTAIEFPMRNDAMDYVYYNGDMMRRKWANDACILLADKTLTAADFLQKTVKNIYGFDKELYIRNKRNPLCLSIQQYAMSLLNQKSLPPPRFIRLLVDYIYGVDTHFFIRNIIKEDYATNGKVITIAS